MRILFISNVYPLPHHRTRGIFNAQLVGALRRNGADVRCVVPISWTLRPWGRMQNAVEAPAGTVYQRWFYPPKVLRHYYHHFMWWSLRRPLRSAIRDWVPDLVLAFWIHPDGEVARRFAREIGAQAVVMAGGSDLLVIAADRRRKRQIARVLRSVDGVLTDGHHLATSATELGADPARVHAFHRGVDPELFSPGDRQQARERLGLPANEPVLLSVGNLVRVKGHDVLIESLAAAGADAPWHLKLVGNGPERDRLQRQAQRLGVGSRVSFVGSVPHERLGDWYRAADLVVLPSRSEGIPNVLLEAMACGTPFVATRVGGVAEITPDPGWLVAPDDSAGLAAMLRQRWASKPSASVHRPRDWDVVAIELLEQFSRWRNPQ